MNQHPPQRIATYVRTSSEDQAERQTIQGQLHFLTQYTALMGITVVETYADDGVSGTIPLGERPAGRRLLADAKAGRFDGVLLYKLDRLGRTLRVLLDAYGELDALGVTLRSATEPFDTSSSIGRFIFQVLGSIAELDRNGILERTAMGRERVARAGRWVNGPVPYGYVLDDGGHLTPATDPICTLEGQPASEADVIRFIYTRILAGGTTVGVAALLAGLEVPSYQKVQTRGRAPVITPSPRPWRFSKVRDLIANPAYYGRSVYHGRNGEEIVRQCPPLVTEDDWRRAQQQMKDNRRLSSRGGQRDYLLRGMVRCGNCGMAYVGAAMTGAGGITHYYRCSGTTTGGRRPGALTHCTGKMLRAIALENAVWEQTADLLRDPDAVLDQVHLRLVAERTAPAADTRAAVAQLEGALTDQAGARDQMLDLYRRRLIDLPALERQLDASNTEEQALRGRLAALHTIAQTEAAAGEYVQSLGVILATAASELHAVTDQGSVAQKRAVLAPLLEQVTVITSGAGVRKTARVRVTYRFGHVVDMG